MIREQQAKWIDGKPEARRLMQGDFAVLRSVSRHVSGDLAMFLVKHDRSGLEDHDGEE